MKSTPFQKLLKDSFQLPNHDAWTHIAKQEIEGKDPFDTLQWQTADGLDFLPYYDKTTIKSVKGSPLTQLQPSEKLCAAPREWVNLPSIQVINEVAANTAALNLLNAGAEGILFDIRTLNTIDANALLKNINWQHCNISFRLTQNASTILAYIQKQNFKNDILAGTFLYDDIEDCIHSINPLQQPALCTLGLIVATNTPVEEIADALVKGVHILDVATNHGYPAEEIIKHIAFSINVDADLMLSIAKLKTLRLLWYHIAQAYKINTYKVSDLHIHARSESWVDKNYQPHGNMLKETSASLAGVLGGCDTLTVFPEDEQNSTMNRIAKNVSNILKEESHVDKVADATYGSYALQALIDNLALTAWKKFLDRNAIQH